MSASAEAITTARLRPDLFVEPGARSLSRTLLVAAVVAIVLAGFGFRASGLSIEGLSEDELNKLNAVADYRAHGLTAANGEHPMLMKAILTASVVGAEAWNSTTWVMDDTGNLRIPVEAALRLPGAVVGALTALLIYLLTTELFGTEVALMAAALWALDPSAIGFGRIAKEDTFVLFFFLLANIFWLHSQRVAEMEPNRRPQPFYWATGAAFGAMIASKYVPQLMAITISYYYTFQLMPETKWRLGKKRLLTLFGIAGLVFIILSPTILLPETWHQMRAFASGSRIGHDSYEFMGTLYTHRITDWLRGIPWYFYLVFIGVKLPVPELVTFLVGLPLLFRRKLGDGRYFVLFWLFFWFLIFGFVGGKFTRYFTTLLPAVLITAAIGIHTVSRWVAARCASLFGTLRVKPYARAACGLAVVFGVVGVSVAAAPHFRLFTNLIGGGESRAGFYFPHEEFYDSSMKQAMEEISKSAGRGAHVASETPALATYYAQIEGRADLNCVSSSDPASINDLRVGDFIVAARGRRYFSNDRLLLRLRQSRSPAFSFSLGGVHSMDVYSMDKESLTELKEVVAKA